MLWQLQLQWFDRPQGLFHRRLLRHLATNGSDATSFPPNASSDGSGSIDDDVIAYAVPTFQCPSSFLDTDTLPFPSDSHVLKNVVEFITEQQQQQQAFNASIRMSTAYLNPTTNLMKLLKSFATLQMTNNSVYVLSAGPLIHGFSCRQCFFILFYAP